MNIKKIQKALRYFIPVLLGLSMIACKTQNKTNHGGEEHKYTNHLINESSPYLLQHAHNPVDWHPWGEEALQKAKDEDKMLIISVGYAACHWCHVMEHESFEDSLVAKIMNDNFICIKVDREERPDIDDVYMTACQMSSGRSCGWPLNCFAFADGRPFWAGTYFPKDKWMDVLNSFVEMKQDEPQKLEKAATEITRGIQGSGRIVMQEGEVEFTRENLDGIVGKFLQQVDMKKGGRKGSPKFPMPNNYEFLLKYNQLSGNAEALQSLTATLDNMAFGGIYDQLGGGFSRYSTDDRWFAPHFEKMLYDNGQLIGLYSKAYRQSKNPLYKQIVEESITFIERELTNDIGGFYASLDADSEGEEGKFYVWTKNEIDSIIGNTEIAEIFNEYYEVKKRGNWEHGNNILHRKKSNAEIAKKFNLTEADLKTKIEEGKAKLFKARDGRIRPGLDDKVLTAWNALMLDGYVEAYKAFGNESYRAAALKNGNFILKEMMDKDFRLDRNYKNGKSTINAFLDDYAQTINAFINLYQITFDEKWLDNAKGLTDYALVHFFDNESGMLNYTSDIDPPLVARKMDLSDNVIPGSNSSMARALQSLGHFLFDKNYLEKAHQMMHNLNAQLVATDQPSFYSNWCQLYIDFTNPPYEVAIIGDDFEAKRKDMMSNYLPNVIFLGGKKEGKLELLQHKLAEGETMIYVCQDKVCKFPVTEVAEALKLVE